MVYNPEEVFREVVSRVLNSGKFKGFEHTKLAHCELAEAENKENPERVCHVNHRPNVICYARKLGELTLNQQVAILLHEIGHMAVDEDEEGLANAWVEEHLGVVLR